AIAATRDYKEADLVVAPVTAAPSLVPAIRVDGVPNPGFVVLNRGLDPSVVADVKAALFAATGDEIEGWRAPVGYGALASRMAETHRSLIVAAPPEVNLELKAITQAPATGFAPSALRPRWWATR